MENIIKKALKLDIPIITEAATGAN